MSKNPKWMRDELILALELYFRVDPIHNSEQHPEIVALSDLLNRLPIHAKSDREEKFRNPNGVYMKLCNFLRLDPNYPGEGLKAGSKLEEEIWEDFAGDKDRLKNAVQAIRDNYSTLATLQPGVEDKASDDEEFTEGQILTRIHKFRERKPSLVLKKKKQILKKTGKLACEVCGFDFEERYGELGKDFAECHHNKPVYKYKPGDKTSVDELSIVCANCHRILHRAKPWITVQELILII